jgi:hypothetical protein
MSSETMTGKKTYKYTIELSEELDIALSARLELFQSGSPHVKWTREMVLEEGITDRLTSVLRTLDARLQMLVEVYKKLSPDILHTMLTVLPPVDRARLEYLMQDKPSLHEDL